MMLPSSLPSLSPRTFDCIDTTTTTPHCELLSVNSNPPPFADLQRVTLPPDAPRPEPLPATTFVLVSARLTVHTNLPPTTVQPGGSPFPCVPIFAIDHLGVAITDPFRSLNRRLPR